jgi:hypothetical protein
MLISTCNQSATASVPLPAREERALLSLAVMLSIGYSGIPAVRVAAVIQETAASAANAPVSVQW